MKRFLAILITLVCLFSCFGCAADAPAETTEPTQAGASAAALEALDGKNIIFVGNSYTHVGKVVFSVGNNNLDQSMRENDRGYFYQLCKARGIDVSVTSWTFGAHDLTASLGHNCSQNTCKNVDHLSHLTDPRFDYVALQLYIERAYTGDLNTHLQPLMDIFRQANPDVKFLLLIPHMAYDRNYAWVKDLAALELPDVTVCNWGGMLYDIVRGKVQVPGATQPYSRPTFVVSRDENDGHHQNLLVGYLTAAMVYSAITGESAVGLPYGFCDDLTINPEFNMEAFKQKNYVYDTYTNFVEVYNSPADMNGLQQLIDQYLQTGNS